MKSCKWCIFHFQDPSQLKFIWISNYWSMDVLLDFAFIWSVQNQSAYAMTTHQYNSIWMIKLTFLCFMFKMCGPLCVCSWYYLSLVNSIKFILGLCVLFLVGGVNCSNSMSLDDVSCFWQRIPFCLHIADICFLNNSWMFACYFAVLLFNVWLIKLFSDCSNVFPRFSCFT